MEIQIRFNDGTTEMRDAESPSIADIFEPRLRHPSEERWYLYFPDESVPFSFCGHSIRKLSDWRGEVLVWRTTWDPETKVLSGAWAAGRVESVDEQIERLTREREEARRLVVNADEMERRIAAVEAVRNRAKALRERLRGQDGEHTAMINQRAWESVVRILRGTREDPSSLPGMGS